MKQMRCRKELGTWFYEKHIDHWKEVAPFYVLYNESMEEVEEFDTYAEMLGYLETKHIVEKRSTVC